MDASLRFRVSAISAAILFGIGLLMGVLVPGGGEVTDKEFTDFYDSDGKRWSALLLLFVLIAGCVAMLWFFAELRRRLDRGSLLSDLGYSIAAFGLVGVAAGGAVMLAPSGVQLNSDADFVGTNVAHAFSQAGLGMMLIAGIYPLGVAVALFSIAAHRANAIPQWFAVAGVIAAVLLLAAFIYVPAYILPLWVLAFGIVGVRPRQA